MLEGGQITLKVTDQRRSASRTGPAGSDNAHYVNQTGVECIGPTGGNVRPAAISSNVFSDKGLVAITRLMIAPQNFPKSPAPEIFRQISHLKVSVKGIYVDKVPVQECKTAHSASLLPPISCSLP